MSFWARARTFFSSRVWQVRGFVQRCTAATALHADEGAAAAAAGEEAEEAAAARRWDGECRELSEALACCSETVDSSLADDLDTPSAVAALLQARQRPPIPSSSPLAGPQYPRTCHRKQQILAI